jgi:hypothetical protein
LVKKSGYLLLAFVSTVILGFGRRRDPWPYFCSFQDHLCILKVGFLFYERRDSRLNFF